MLESFYNDHIENLKDYDKNNKGKYSKLKPQSFFIFISLFIITYIIYVSILFFNEMNTHLFLLFLFILIVFALQSIRSFYNYNLRKEKYLSERQSYLAKYYASNLKISLFESSTHTLTEEFEKKDNASTRISSTNLNDNQFKELANMYSNLSSSKKIYFKVNFSILPLLLAFGIAYINIIYSQPDDMILNQFSSSLDGIEKLSTSSPSEKNNQLIKEISEKIYTSIDQYKQEEKNKKLYTLVSYSVAIFLFYLIFIFLAKRLENYANKKSDAFEHLANTLYESHFLKTGSEK